MKGALLCDPYDLWEGCNGFVQSKNINPLLHTLFFSVVINRNAGKEKIHSKQLEKENSPCAICYMSGMFWLLALQVFIKTIEPLWQTASRFQASALVPGPCLAEPL